METLKLPQWLDHDGVWLFPTEAVDHDDTDLWVTETYKLLHHDEACVSLTEAGGIRHKQVVVFIQLYGIDKYIYYSYMALNIMVIFAKPVVYHRLKTN